MESEPKKRVTRRAAAKAPVVVPVKAVPQRGAAVKKVKVTRTTTPKTSSETKKPVHKKSIKSPYSSDVVAEVTETNADPETVKMVTGPLSPRLREKLALYELWYRTEAPRYMEGTAKLFGYAFITSGFLLAFTLTAGDTIREHGLVASLECSLDGCPELTTTVEPVTTPLLLPQVQFVTAPIVVPDRDTDVTIALLNAVEHTFSIISRETGAKTTLKPAGNDGAGMFTYRIPTSTLAPGEYKIFVKATATDTTTKTEFAGPTFSVPERPATTSTVVSTTSTTTTTTQSGTGSGTNTGSSESSQSQPSLTPDPADEDDEIEEEDVQVPVVATTTGQTVETTSPLVSTPETETSGTIGVSIVPGVFPQQYKITINPTYKYSTVELYIRAENSTQPLFLGVASRTSTGWLYWLDASSQPAGRFRIMVRGMENGVLRHTAEVRFDNVKVTTYAEEPEYQEVKNTIEREAEKIASATSSPLAPLSAPTTKLIPTLFAEPLPETDEESLDDSHVEPGRLEARELLTERNDEFNELLRRYASALQSGDDTILRLAESEIDKKIDGVLSESLTEKDESVFTLESELRAELEDIKERVVRVENFKKERTAEASTVDTDKDGISDYDEYLLYETDPKNPDTDSDGVVDGVEISLGYDPVDETPEAVIRFNSPREVSYVDEELLGVKTVAPLLLYETDETEPVVQSEISGYGLPNSFVTLYIFSDPIVVTVKTKDDGSFSYTFTKELEDGEHEVYAALTDNRGEIVVRSTAFKFVKTAEAFTYVDETPETATALTGEEGADLTTTYNLVAAMGVVSFGLILLLLGIVLRHDRQKTSVVTT